MITISGVTRRGGGFPTFLENFKFFPNGSPLCFSPNFLKLFFKNYNGLPLWFFTKNDQNFLFFHQKGPKIFIFSTKIVIFYKKNSFAALVYNFFVEKWKKIGQYWWKTKEKISAAGENLKKMLIFKLKMLRKLQFL